MAEIVEWGPGILHLLECMGGLIYEIPLQCYKITGESVPRSVYAAALNHTRTGLLVELNGEAQLSSPPEYNVVEAGYGWASMIDQTVIKVSETSDPVTNSFTRVQLSLTFTR